MARDAARFAAQDQTAGPAMRSSIFDMYEATRSISGQLWIGVGGMAAME